MKRFLMALACLFGAGGPLALAQAPLPSTQVLSFNQVLNSALASHPLIQAKHSDQMAAKADKAAAEWARYPTPSFEASAGSDGDAAGLLRLDQPLWTGGRISANIRAADKRVTASEAATGEARLDVTLRAIAAYTEALRQKAKKKLAENSVAEHESLLAMIQRRVRQEVSSLADERLAQSRLFLAQNDLSLTTQALQNALAQLSQLAGTPITDVEPFKAPVRDLPSNLETVQQMALESSPTLQRLAQEEEAAAAEIDSRRSVFLPQLAFRLEHSDSSGTNDNRALVVLQAQPGAGLSSISGVDAAIARKESIRKTREAAIREVRERIAIDWNEFEASRQRMVVSRYSSNISSEVFESYKRQYVIGRKTWIDVLNAIREVTQSLNGLEDANAQAAASSLRIGAQVDALNTYLE